VVFDAFLYDPKHRYCMSVGVNFEVQKNIESIIFDC
jgi:hypothetical protein